MGLISLNRHYSAYSSTMNQSDYHTAILCAPLFSGCTMLTRHDVVLPSSDINRSFTRHGLRPWHDNIHSPFNAYIVTDFHDMKRLALLQQVLFRGWIPSRFRIVAGKHHRCGFTWFVAAPRTHSCSGLVVSLCPCWIVQLAYISLSWHSHIITFFV